MTEPRRSAAGTEPRCWGCGGPLPPERFAPSHRVYHDRSCRDLHRKKLAEFEKENPELPGRGRSPVPRPARGDVLRVVRLAPPDGRLAVRFAKGPARRAVRDHHGTDSLPLAYYLDPDAGAAEAATFLRRSYPEADVPTPT